MNILDLLKKLFAVFAVASMVLACVARPFLLLLNWLPGDVRTFFED